jgi:hypothetical protein
MTVPRLGRPREGKLSPPRYVKGSGLIALSHLQDRAHRRWTKLGLTPIGLHEARHTAATWLDHAGMNPKVASQLMAHKTPKSHKIRVRPADRPGRRCARRPEPARALHWHGRSSVLLSDGRRVRRRRAPRRVLRGASGGPSSGTCVRRTTRSSTSAAHVRDARRRHLATPTICRATWGARTFRRR